jgi:hypothetical protein
LSTVSFEACIISAFYEDHPSELVRQLLVDAYCLHATKGTELAKVSVWHWDGEGEAKAWWVFYTRVIRKMNQALQSKEIKELDPKDYKIVDVCKEEQG